MQLDVGQRFDRYQVNSHLGNGISGQSYEAQDTLLQRTVVLKLIHPWTPLSDAIRRQFFRELQNMSILNHPIIASILDYGDIDGQLYLARKYTSPGSLLSTQGRSWFMPPLSLAQAIRYTTQIAQGLHYLHVRGFLHGALTLSNILVQHNPTQLGASNAPLLVSDAGTAHFVRRYGHPFITLLPITSAPEQFNKRTVPASDQYALAAILYYWLAGRPPFLGTPDEIEQQKQQGIEISLSTFTTPITPELAQIMQRALSPSIEERYPSLQIFWEELQQVYQPSLYEETNPSLSGLNQNGHVSEESEPGHTNISLFEAFSTLHTYTVPNTSQKNKTTTGSHNTGALEKLLNTMLSTNSTEEVPSPGRPDAEKPSLPVQPEKEPQPETNPDPIKPEPTPQTEPIPDPVQPEPTPQPHPDVPQPLPDPTPTPPPAPEIIPERTPEPPKKSLPEIIPPAPDIANPLHNSNRATKHSTMLVITSQYVGEPYEVVIDREEMTIGRAGSSDILLDFDPFTSRHHALLQKHNGQYFLYDRRSAYGTSVNGQALPSDQGRLLQDGDQISIGQYTLLFSIGTTQEIHDRASQNAQV